MRLRLPVVLFLSSLTTSAYATGEIESIMTDRDRKHLTTYDQAREEALDVGRAEGAPADVKALEAVMDRPSISFQGIDLTGNWQCRTIKIGGPAPLVIYGWFKCRVTDDGSGWRLEKLTGSQRTQGRFFTAADDRLTYLGSFYVTGETPLKHGVDPDHDQLGVALASSPSQWRIEFPAPPVESKFDILELKR